jgi:hypothetical protein
MLINKFEGKRILFATKITTLIIYNCAARHYPRETGDSNNEEYIADQKYAKIFYGIFVRRRD